MWNIGLAARIRKSGLISSDKRCLPCRHLPTRSQHRETAAGCEACIRLAIIAREQC